MQAIDYIQIDYILMQARLFEPAMRGEILVHMKNCGAEKKGAAKPASGAGESDCAFTSSSTNGGEESAKAKEKRGGEMYARAQKIFASKLPFDAHERPSYNTIAEMHAAYVEGLPFGIGLEEFKPQLKLQGSSRAPRSTPTRCSARRGSTRPTPTSPL